MGRLPIGQIVPRKLIVEARIKEGRKYRVTWRVEKLYFGQDTPVNTYVSGYFDDERTPEQWWDEYNQKIAQSQYEQDYLINKHSLAAVRHRLGADY